ncbi:hypothetical protein ZIOFF_013520 [Zingiber officinale]|uniref:Uncharacterized protein n=1 Tax=Zingiber officinale TaxID=94328 RepID=A0A8J5HBX0_ZINOF|nr:hypothetical protein ZIOFF_013520 [Zingiber officinale]
MRKGRLMVMSKVKVMKMRMERLGRKVPEVDDDRFSEEGDGEDEFEDDTEGSGRYQVYTTACMAHSPAVNHVCYAIALLCTASYCCQAQDAIQIVANAALCFDNRMVINNCLMSMGINTNGSSGSNGTMSNSTTIEPKPHGKSNATTEKSNATTNSNATTMTLCSSPCYGQMMLTATCMDGILSSFPFYSPGLVQGVQAIVNMSCRGMANSTTNSTTNSTVSHLAEPGKEELLVMAELAGKLATLYVRVQTPNCKVQV